MRIKKSLAAVLRATQTVFTIQDLALFWAEPDAKAVSAAAQYYTRTGQLHKIRRGLYAKNEKYDRLELASKIIVPSYVSFETVLLRSGMIFQYYSSVFLASYATRELVIGDQKFIFRKVQNAILNNPAGVIHEKGISIASLERAFLDRLYLAPDYYFDSLRPLDWSKVLEILPIYRNKRMERVVKQQHKQYELQRARPQTNTD